MSKWKYRIATETTEEVQVDVPTVDIQSQVKEYVNQILLKYPNAVDAGISIDSFNDCINASTFEEGKSCVDTVINQDDGQGNRTLDTTVNFLNRVFTPKDYSNFQGMEPEKSFRQTRPQNQRSRTRPSRAR